MEQSFPFADRQQRHGVRRYGIPVIWRWLARAAERGDIARRSVGLRAHRAVGQAQTRSEHDRWGMHAHDRRKTIARGMLLLPLPYQYRKVQAAAQWGKPTVSHDLEPGGPPQAPPVVFHEASAPHPVAEHGAERGRRRHGGAVSRRPRPHDPPSVHGSGHSAPALPGSWSGAFRGCSCGDTPRCAH